MARRHLSVLHIIAAKAAKNAPALNEEASEPVRLTQESSILQQGVTAETRKGRGRPLGKRSDPEFKPTTLFLRTRTKRAASRLLEDQADERDLSELVEDLLVQWTRR